MYKQRIEIVICDDEEFTCLRIKDITLNFFKKAKIDVKINMFYSGKELYEYIDNGNTIDILFLDIELGEITGIDAGRYIRNNQYKNETKIIYISSKESYAMQLFKIRPFDFLIKPIMEKDIKEVLGQVLKKLDREDAVFEYSIGKEYSRIRVSEILYFYSEGKKIKIVTHDINNNIEFYGKLKDVSKALSDKFLYIHKSYLVNFDAVDEYKYDSVKIINGDILSISQANRKDIRLRIMNEKRMRV